MQYGELVGLDQPQFFYLVDVGELNHRFVATYPQLDAYDPFDFTGWAAAPGNITAIGALLGATIDS